MFANKLFLTILSFIFLAAPLLIFRHHTPSQRRRLRLLSGILFIVLIVIGLTLREYKDIYINAVTLCLSCIGIM